MHRVKTLYPFEKRIPKYNQTPDITKSPENKTKKKMSLKNFKYSFNSSDVFKKSIILVNLKILISFKHEKMIKFFELFSDILERNNIIIVSNGIVLNKSTKNFPDK